MRLRRSQQIPPITRHVVEQRDTAVGFIARLRYELDATVPHPPPRSLEVLDSKKQTDAAGELVTNRMPLPVTVSPRQQQAGMGTRRADDNPPLEATVVRRRRRVLDQLEPEHCRVELDRLVVVVHNQRHKFQLHTLSLAGDAMAAARSTP